MHCGNCQRMHIGIALGVIRGTQVGQGWAECYNHTGYVGTLGGSGRGPLWTPHFCGTLCSVTVPNETLQSCESTINLWLRPPPWGESCHSHGCISPPSTTPPLLSFLLLIDWAAALQSSSTSTTVAFAPSAETIHHFFGRLLQTLQDGWKAAWNKCNLSFWSNIQALASWNPSCCYNTARSEKTNLVPLPSPESFVEVWPQ